MANLKALRERIQNITDYKPTNLEALNDLDTLVNDAYRYTWLCRSWSFAQKLSYLNVYPDLDNDITGATIAVSDYSRNVVFSTPIRSLVNDVWAGQYIEIQGREYKILQVVSDTTIRLAEPFRGTTVTAGASWVLKQKYYELPEDLVQILSLAHRDAPIVGGTRKHLVGVANRREEELQLEENRTADYADFYIHIPPLNIAPGEKLLQVAATYETGSTIGASSYYEFAWAFKVGKEVGPLSDPLLCLAGTNQGGTPVINLKPITHDNVVVAAPAYSNVMDKLPNPFEGLRKVLYTNVNLNHTTGERLGLPKWVLVTYYTGTATRYDHQPYELTDEQADWKIKYLQQVSPGNPRYIEIDGHHHCVRPYPRINDYDFKYDWAVDQLEVPGKPEEYFRQLELRYIYKPKEIVTITDSPEMPFELHDLIVYKALEDYYTKRGNPQLAQVYRNRFEMDIKASEMKYIERADVVHQRALQFGTGRNPLLFPSTNITRSSF